MLLATLRRDAIAQATLALAAAMLWVYLLLPDHLRTETTAQLTDLPLLLLALLALLRGLAPMQRLERRFWQLWAAGIGCWILVRVSQLAAPAVVKETPAFGVACSLGYTALYAAVIGALELKPSLPPAEPVLLRFRWLQGLGSAVTATALFGYLALLPLAHEKTILQTQVPLSVLYVCLDCYLLVRLALLLGHSTGTWRPTYGALLVAALSWTAADALETLRWAGTVSARTVDVCLDALWLPPLVAVPLAARLRRHFGDGTAAEPPERVSTTPRGSLLVAQALLLPALHFVLLRLGVWDEAGEPLRRNWVTASLITLGGLAVLYLRSLERLASQRTAALEKSNRELEASLAALEAARDDAEAATLAKGRFLAAMSHEIRTPMNGVLGTGSLLLRTSLTPPQRRLAETMQSSGRALLAILDDILDVSRLETGRVQLSLETFDLAELAEDVTESLAELAHAKGLELTCLCEGLDRPLRGDPVRLRQILINLVGNAIKFTDTGEVAVFARPLGEAGGLLGVRVDVADTGVGIEAAARARLFESFGQAAAGRHRGGSGLGLVISRQLAGLMGGEIEFESEPNRGSCFRLTLPIAIAGPASRQARLTHSTRVVIAEPQATSQFVLERLCGELGADTRVVAGAAELVRLLHQLGPPPDAVLVAAELLWTDGGALASEIEASGPKGTRWIAVVRPGWAAEAPVDRRLLTLSKPVRRHALLRALEATEVDRIAGQEAGPGASELRGRVLVVEDNPVNQAVAEGMLRVLGFEVDLARDGNEALARLGVGGYAAVLMDCMMPGLDGFETARELRRREQASGLARAHIVAVTASAMAGDRERCLAAGMDDYLAKPFTVETLGAVLARSGPPPRFDLASPSAS